MSGSNGYEVFSQFIHENDANYYLNQVYLVDKTGNQMKVSDIPEISTQDIYELVCEVDGLGAFALAAGETQKIHIALKLLFALMFWGILTGYLSNQAMAQSVTNYNCQNEVSTQVFPGINLVQCTIKEAVDEKKIRYWSNQVYANIHGHNYSDITIAWKLYLESEKTSYLSDIGYTRFLNGTLVDLHIPLAKEKEAVDETAVIINFAARLGAQEPIDKLRKKYSEIEILR